jgi:hypothetical protein
MKNELLYQSIRSIKIDPERFFDLFLLFNKREFENIEEAVLTDGGGFFKFNFYNFVLKRLCLYCARNDILPLTEKNINDLFDHLDYTRSNKLFIKHSDLHRHCSIILKKDYTENYRYVCDLVIHSMLMYLVLQHMNQTTTQSELDQIQDIKEFVQEKYIWMSEYMKKKNKFSKYKKSLQHHINSFGINTPDIRGRSENDANKYLYKTISGFLSWVLNFVTENYINYLSLKKVIKNLDEFYVINTLIRDSKNKNEHVTINGRILDVDSIETETNDYERDSYNYDNPWIKEINEKIRKQDIYRKYYSSSPLNNLKYFVVDVLGDDHQIYCFLICVDKTKYSRTVSKNNLIKLGYIGKNIKLGGRILDNIRYHLQYRTLVHILTNVRIHKL